MAESINHIRGRHIQFCLLFRNIVLGVAWRKIICWSNSHTELKMTPVLDWLHRDLEWKKLVTLNLSASKAAWLNWGRNLGLIWVAHVHQFYWTVY